MNSVYFALISVLSYIISAGLLAKAFYRVKPHVAWRYLAILAVLGHISYTGLTLVNLYSFSFSFFNTASIVAALVAGLLILVSSKHAIEKLGLIVFPLAAILLCLDVIFPENNQAISTQNWHMDTHIFSSIIAFGLLNIAALQAILLSIQEQQLRQHPPNKLMLHLPALQTMEALLFQMLTLGVLFLSVSLITGFIFIEDLFAQHLVHKTVLSICAWLIFTGLLLGRHYYGWRGQTAIRCTLSGFVMILLAYFGSKLVLEIILSKH